MQVATLRNKPVNPVAGDLAGDMLRPWVDAYESWRSGVTGLLDRSITRSNTGDCGCAQCAPDDCRCTCCVADSDLVIETRLGERRVVSITIENSWRRPREIELELLSWTRTEGVQIDGKIITPTSFTIEPCGEAQVMLLIGIGATNVKATDKAAEKTAVSRAAGDNRSPDDVDECTVGYADLRVKGCDIRPIRIAAAVLPRHCDDYVIDCRSGCC